MNARKPALEAQTDQVLAGAREARRHSGVTVEVTLPVAEDFAAEIREEFPADQEVIGRALAASASMLGGLLKALLDGGASPEWAAIALVNTLGLAAESVHRKAGDPS